MNAKQAIAILVGRETYKYGEDQRDIADLIKRQQAVCDAAKEFTDKYAKYEIGADKLIDALKRLDGDWKEKAREHLKNNPGNLEDVFPWGEPERVTNKSKRLEDKP